MSFSPQIKRVLVDKKFKRQYIWFQVKVSFKLCVLGDGYVSHIPKTIWRHSHMWRNIWKCQINNLRSFLFAIKMWKLFNFPLSFCTWSVIILLHILCGVWRHSLNYCVIMTQSRKWLSVMKINLGKTTLEWNVLWFMRLFVKYFRNSEWGKEKLNFCEISR